MTEHRYAAEQLLRSASRTPTPDVSAGLAQAGLVHALLAIEHRLGELVAEQRATRELMAGVYDPEESQK